MERIIGKTINEENLRAWHGVTLALMDQLFFYKLKDPWHDPGYSMDGYSWGDVLQVFKLMNGGHFCNHDQLNFDYKLPEHLFNSNTKFRRGQKVRIIAQDFCYNGKTTDIGCHTNVPYKFLRKSEKDTPMLFHTAELCGIDPNEYWVDWQEHEKGIVHLKKSESSFETPFIIQGGLVCPNDLLATCLV
jgi:hypothetical protein